MLTCLWVPSTSKKQHMRVISLTHILKYSEMQMGFSHQTKSKWICGMIQSLSYGQRILSMTRCGLSWNLQSNNQACHYSLVLCLALSWDVNNAFYHGHFTKDVYISQPLNFVNKQHPHLIYHLKIAFMGLNKYHEHGKRASPIFSLY